MRFKARKTIPQQRTPFPFPNCHFEGKTFAFRSTPFALPKKANLGKKRVVTRVIFNALKIGASKSFSRSTARFNFGFYRPTRKAKTKIKRYLGRALPKASPFENELNIE